MQIRILVTRLHTLDFKRYAALQLRLSILQPPEADGFAQIGEAYQVLSNDDLRKSYDKFGKDQAVPGGGFGKQPKPRNRSHA
jgi:curved DNA-binding protein CbpA